jgi:hypothetical protein
VNSPLPAVRRDSDLRSLDVPAAITRGLLMAGVPRRLLFTDAAIAASWQAQDLGVGPYPVDFLGCCVRAGGVRAALDLPEPLIGAAQTALAREWLSAALAAGESVERDVLVANWLGTVSALLAVRRRASRA